ncbi:geranyl transferase [Pseudoxanthomonas broegbernensis]|uniref:Geranyl transferase n=1 Tax=Pseudoxanthomonas broegbernensis TaxID=83619 RepID=A0A7V8GM68_9GAMM|nr:farnesyl diphosphate synthase [Pseudoxanthomonas broegbernensis]KAF1686232.1 geranyl transferase [Pseudoxanthomonas broegbernensis]MBB6063901.1 farnesyl diphosphate synthase [Pseudoxanthomonas broegbernensis]
MAPEVFARWAARTESTLERRLPASAGGPAEPARLHAAMRHATLGGGKRMRPLLVYAAGSALGADEPLLDAPAAAVELVHAYSLVHDDLPAMDDDALRRGRPTVHVAFDEATAILAGDALQTLAFSTLAEADAPAALRIDWVRTLAGASGVAGMCGGQALDIDATGHGRQEVPDRPVPADGRAGDLGLLERMHALKTGALIRAAVRMGALAAAADTPTLSRLDAFAAALGLAFQVRDDLLDIEASSQQLGKTAGKDVAQAKSTYPALLGVDGARARLEELAEEMRGTLAVLGDRANALAALGELAIRRSY